MTLLILMAMSAVQWVSRACLMAMSLQPIRRDSGRMPFALPMAATTPGFWSLALAFSMPTE